MRLFLLALFFVNVNSPRVPADETPNAPVYINVTTDKIAYAPGSEVQLKVSVANKGQTPVNGRLKVSVVHDLNQDHVILEQNVDVAPGKETLVAVAWTSLNKELWGCEAKAELFIAGRRIALGRRVFVVSDNLPKVSANYGITHPMAYGAATEENFNKVFDYYARCAVPIVEIFAWTPSVWGHIMPDKEQWIEGQCRFRESVKHIEGTIEHAHRRGMKVMAYASPVFRGLAGYRWAKAHPEQILYTTPEAKLPPMSAEQIKAWEEANANVDGISAEKLEKLHMWSAPINSSNNETVDNGMDQYIAAIKRFNFDGIRWDGNPSNWYHPVRDWWSRIGSDGKILSTAGYDWKGNLITPDDPDAENVRITKRFRGRLRAALPDVIEGFNIQARNAFSPDMPEIEESRQFPLTHAEFMPGNIMLDEKHFASQPDGSLNMYSTWSRAVKVLLRGNEMIHQFGAYHYVGGMPASGAGPFILHIQALAYSIGVRTFGTALHYGQYPAEYEDFLTFGQRYSRYLFHPSRLRFVPTKKQGGRVAVSSPRPVMFKPLCYYLATDKKFTVIVHLWNRPVSDTMNIKHCQKPPLVEDARVTIRQPLGMIPEKARAYVLSPEWKDQCREVKVDLTKSDVDVPVPAFRYWAIVMLQYPMVPEGADKATHHWFLPIQE